MSTNVAMSDFFSSDSKVKHIESKWFFLKFTFFSLYRSAIPEAFFKDHIEGVYIM